MDEQSEDDRTHLLEVLEGVESDLVVFWQVAAELLRRNANGELAKALSSNFLRACDGVKHSVGWLQAMPLRADDGTSVWEPLPEAAVTNEPEVRSDPMEGRPQDADRVGRGGQERDFVPNGTNPGDQERALRIAEWKLRETQRKALAAKGRPARRFPARKGARK